MLLASIIDTYVIVFLPQFPVFVFWLMLMHIVALLITAVASRLIF